MYNAPCILHTKSEIPSAHSIFGGIQILNFSNKIGSSSPRVIAVHGNGVMAGKWVSESIHAQNILDSAGMSFENLGSSIRGSLTVYILDPVSRKIVILCDPFGSSILYIYESAEFTAVSTDLASLRDGLKTHGCFLEKNLEYAALYVASSTGGLSKSSYKDVRSLRPYQYVEIGASGINEIDYKLYSDLSFSGLSYEQLLQNAAEDVVNNIEASLGHDTGVRISQLTGGLDSRLVLGALLSSGHASKFNFYCAGNVDEPDKVIARQLCAHFGLDMTEYSGLTSTGHPESFEALLSQPFEETAGIISGPAHPLMEYGDDLVLSGGYGEYLRSAFDKGQLFDGDYAAALERLFGRAAFSSFPTRRLVSEHVYQHAVDSLKQLVNEGNSKGIPLESSLDGAYILGRNRYFVGETTRSLSPYIARFDPLYSPYVLALGLRGNTEEKSANVPIFDLMNKFDTDLMRLPFDSPRIKPAYEKLRGSVVEKKFAHDRSVSPNLVSHSRQRSTPGTRRSFFTTPNASDVNLAKSLHTAPRLVAQNTEIQSRLSNLVNDYGMSEISDYFNPLIVKLMIDREPTHRLHLRQNSNLYAALLWFLK